MKPVQTRLLVLTLVVGFAYGFAFGYRLAKDTSVKQQQTDVSYSGMPVLPSPDGSIKSGKKIIKQTTDERGLISVQYREDGEELGYDYLTAHEYDSIFNCKKYKP